MFNVPMKFVELIFEQSGIVSVTDKEGCYIYVNKKWQEDTGISEKEAIGKYNHDLIEGSRALSAIKSGKVLTADFFIRRIDGKSLPGIMTYVPIHDKKNDIIGCYISSSFSCIEKALEFSERLEAVTEEYEFLKKEMRKRSGVKYSIDDIIGQSDAVKRLKENIYLAGASDSTVLIEGETGTGKELVAHSIHSCSLRNIFSFVKVNCSAIPATLMESEFFGYEEGTFTGAKKGGKRGKFEMAHLGSIFLDEINQMDLTIQPKLLRVLQEKEIERIGSSESTPIDTRVISASNVSLSEMVKHSNFRDDLFYRLNIINIVIPPLRKRREDIPDLADSIIYKLNKKLDRPIEGISSRALTYLKQRDWPGNVRELQNIIERAMNVSMGRSITLDDIKKIETVNIHKWDNKSDSSEILRSSDASLADKKQSIEKDAIINALKSCDYNRTKAAKDLGISRTLLYQKIKKYNIDL
ncbi:MULTISPECIES: sigma-54 interaction domain-containing protein [unclassified Sedimentibacter]|uniref:sigma-54 interaction domain-containing protein n=1 Tax=unclassified Sedimentibacter TaxID=2649220 RepID=UPI0027E1AA2C|nr:sigma 54-interacting transcriptional regulator [Sedimentibacter sp. MB35-C1]WMJ78709.1 sigma 54-interacting transcriptional regulator [Sedimentibacter sp. MB35-C1]